MFGLQGTDLAALPVHRGVDAQLLFAAIALRFGAQPVTLAVVRALRPCSLRLPLIDWDTTLLPDSLTLPLLWAGLWPRPRLDHRADRPRCGARCAGYLSLWAVYWFFKLATGKEGMGYGDFKLLAALGAWLGWQMIAADRAWRVCARRRRSASR